MNFMITRKSSGPITNCSQTFKDQEEVSSMKKKEEPQASRKLVRALSAFLLQKASLYTQRTIPANERRRKVIHAHSPDGGYLAVAVCKMVIKMLRHYDQDERQTDGSRHWDTIRPVLLRACAQQGAREFDEGFWLHLIHEGSNKRRLEWCKDNNGSLCYLRAIQGHSGGIPISPELMNHTLIPYKWKEYIFHRGISWNFRSILVSGIIPRGKENDRARQAVFFPPLNPFGNDPDEEEPHFDCTVLSKGTL